MSPVMFLGGGASEPVDPNFKNVSLLLRADGTNGAQNNTFIDSSSNNITITRGGNATQGTFSPFSQPPGYWSVYFSSNTDYFLFNGGTALAFGTSDFTIECFVRVISGTINHFIYDSRPTSTQGAYPVLYVNGTTVYWYGNGQGLSGGITVDTWHHIAVSRSGTSLRLFINGVQQGSTLSDGTSYLNPASRPAVGTSGFAPGGTDDCLGYISNLRVLKGTALYTSNFTPPTGPLTAITNTQFLYFQDNRFVDNSLNNIAPTQIYNYPLMVPMSPFSPVSAYSPDTNGGSYYFDGTGDYAVSATNANLQFGTGAFSLEAWFYTQGAQTNHGGILSGGSDTDARYGAVIGLNAMAFSFNLTNNATAAWYYEGVSVVPGQWYHLVLARTGTTLSAFVNGVRVATTTQGTDLQQNRYALGTWMVDNPTRADYISEACFVSNARILKGSSAYDPTQTTLTVPQAPLTAITNTQFLALGTNGGLFDLTAKNNIETLSNACINSTTKKFGTGSLALDGSSYLKLIANTAFEFGAADFTIEAWVYATSSVNYRTIFSTRPNTYAGGIWVGLETNSWFPVVYANGLVVTSAYSIFSNTWTHLAFVRYNGVMYIYQDGVQRAYATHTEYKNNNKASIGYDAEPNGYPFIGYIDDLRVTKGIARYTANFTPPVEAFPAR